ncbi:hypothetical protein LINGRAHAP2_LOCUS35109, partial [Linum grandiflorum]
PIFYIPQVYWKNASTYILSDLGSKWAKHRRDLFDAYCDEKKSKPENFANVPPGIIAAHWAAFVTNMLDDKALENRDQNKLNRANQLLNHGGGSRPYARVKEKRALELGHEPCRGDVWVEANTRANGSFRQTRAGEIAAHIQELNDQGISCDDINSDCLTQALGTKERKTRIRTMGHGITPTKLRKLSCGSQPSFVASGSSSSSPSINLSLDAYQRLTEDLTEKITQKVTERSQQLLSSGQELTRTEGKMRTMMMSP